MADPRPIPTIPYATPHELRRDVLIFRSTLVAAKVLLALGSFLFAIGGIRLALNRPSAGADDVLLVVAGAAFILLGLARKYDRTPELILNDTSLICTIGNRIELRWCDLADALTVTHGDFVPYLILRLVDPGAQPQPETLWNRPNFDRPPQAEYEDIVLPIGGLDASPDVILRRIRAKIAAARGPG